MLSGLVVCVLVVGAVAFKPAVPFGGMYGSTLPSNEEHELCCAPRYFTFTQTTTSSSVDATGNLLVEMVHADGAYDAISEQFSVRLFEDFFNKTERHVRLIWDYKKEVSYYIIKNGDEERCYVDKTEGKFDEECIPEDATFVGEATLGDHDLVTDSWYFASEDKSEHIIKTVQKEGCVPMALLIRSFDVQTGDALSVINADLYDFSLGICDPDLYFKPPEACNEERALAEPTVEMLKLRRRKGIFY